MAKLTARISICLIILLLFSVLTTGCWDARDVDDRDICTAVVVDKRDEKFQFYVEVPDTSSTTREQGGGGQGGMGISTVIVKGEGKTYAEARMSLDRALNKPIFLGAVQSLILTERLAESGIDQYILRVRQMTEYRKTMDVIITPDNPEDFLGQQPENEATVGFAVENTLENLERLGATYHMSLAELLQKLESTNPCYLLNTLGVRDNEIVLTGSAIFDGGKRIGFIPFEESRGITILNARGRIKPKFDYLIELEDGSFTLETTMRSRSIKASYDGDKPSFDVKLRFDALELYPSSRMTITDDIRVRISELLKGQIHDEIIREIKRSQKEYGCDYLSFSCPFRIAYPEAFETMNWCEAFKKAEFRVDVLVKVRPNRYVDLNPEPAIP